MRRWLLLAAVHLVSCSIERSEYLDEAPAQNECEQSSDCNGGPCSQGLCIADRAELDTLLFDVTLPATSGEYASVRYTKIATDLRKRKPQDAFDLDLDVVAAVTGTLQVKENPDSTCEYAFVDSDAEDGTLPLGDDDTVPGSVTFIPTDRWPGLPVTPYVSEAAALDSADPYEFLVRLAPGDYDVYVVPSGQPESACPVAPQILRGQQIQAGDVELKLQLPTPRKLSLQVLVPVGLSPDTLRGWRVDMLDSSSGQIA